MEDGAQIHVHRRVHGLEYQSTTQQLGVVLLGHDVGSFNNRLGAGVVAKDDTNLILHQEVLVDTCLFETLTGRHIGVFCLLR